MDSHRMIVFSLPLIPNDSSSLLFELTLLILHVTMYPIMFIFFDYLDLDFIFYIISSDSTVLYTIMFNRPRTVSHAQKEALNSTTFFSAIASLISLISLIILHFGKSVSS